MMPTLLSRPGIFLREYIVFSHNALSGMAQLLLRLPCCTLKGNALQDLHSIALNVDERLMLVALSTISDRRAQMSGSRDLGT
jgi:hypothetical protein